MAQVNFSISDELKAELDSLMKLSGAETKPEFMHQMIMALNTHLANSVDMDIDLTKYESVNIQTKKEISSVFKHLLTVVDSNFSTTKQEAVYIEQEKKLFVDKEKAFIDELEKIDAEANKKILVMESEYKQIIMEMQEAKKESDNRGAELKSKTDELIRELESVSSVASQVQSVMAENKELRKQIRSDSDSHKIEINRAIDNIKAIQLEADNFKKENFENVIKLDQTNERIKELKEYSLSQNKELETTKAALNQALGKLEILEQSEDVEIE